MTWQKLFASFLTCFATGTLLAQTFQGGIRGLVLDPGSAVIVGAKVTLTNQATRVSRSMETNEKGEYVFPSLDPSTYTLRVEAAGFKLLERAGITVGTQEFITLDLKLAVGAVSESVMVSGDAPLIETSNASQGQVIDSQTITDQPNLGRNVFLLSKLATNVVPAGDPRYNRFQDQSGSSSISIAGGPIRGNNYLIEGIPVTDSSNRAVIIPSLVSVQEMKLQAGTYDATMGRTAGGVFNTVLKSGSNQFHGDLTGYIRQTEWTANNFFLNRAGRARPETKFKTWAAGFGGPVWIPKVYDGRNKTFFYVTDEAYRQHSPLSDSYAVPTARERLGDFSQSTVTIYDPLTSRASGNTIVRTAFLNNVIPSNRINPVGAAIMRYIPLPDNPAARTGTFNYTGSDSLFDRADQYTAKMDHSFATWLRIGGSYMHYKSREPGGNTLGTPAGGSTSAPFLLYRKVDATAANATIIPNPTTVVNLRYGFNRFPNIFLMVSSGFSPGNLGFPASYVSGLQYQYFPRIDLLNNSISSQTPSWTVFWSKNLLGSVSKHLGRHSITAGMDYRLIHTDFFSPGDAAGRFGFNGVFTRSAPSAGSSPGTDFADLLLGTPSSGTVGTAVKLFDYARYYSGYIQDDFRVSTKLTLNLGLRYEYETGIAESNNRLVVAFDRTAANPLGTATGVNVPGVIRYAGVDGAPTSCCNPNRKKFGPRIGAAYQWNSKTTIRGGWGMFYAPFIFADSASTSPGFTQVTTYVASNDGNATPANSLSNPFPNGILQPVGNTLGPRTAIGSSFNFFDQGATSGLVHQFSVDVQRELPWGIALEVGYVASRSRDLQPSPRTGTPTLNINQLHPSKLSLGSALTSSVPNPFFGRGGSGVIGSANVTRAQLELPFPQYTTIGAFVNPSHAKYDSLVVKVQKRMSNNLTFLSTFTWSKNMDNTWGSGQANYFNTFSGSTPPLQPQNAYDLDAEWSLSGSNTPVRFSNTWTYNLPFGRGKRFLNGSRALDYLVGGWQFNGTATFQTGFPLAIFQSNLNSVINAGAQRPNATGQSPETSGSLGSRIDSYINPGAFSTAPQLTFGNVSRFIGMRGPGEANWDTSIFKNFSITERFNGQFRVEALNTFNTPRFANPNTQFGAGAFGKIAYQANFPRLLQLGLRFAF